jgi:hypothetical protein
MDLIAKANAKNYENYKLDPETGNYINQKDPSIIKTAEEYDELKETCLKNMNEIKEKYRKYRETHPIHPSVTRFNEEYEAYMAQRAPANTFFEELTKVEAKCTELENIIAEKRSRMTDEELAKDMEMDEKRKETKAKYEAILAKMRNRGK